MDLSQSKYQLSFVICMLLKVEHVVLISSM